MSEKPLTLYVDHPVGPPLDRPIGPLPEVQPDFGFARVPLKVLADSRLKNSDKCVFAAIASTLIATGQVRAEVGTRRISELCCIPRSMVNDSLKRLIEFKHLKLVAHVGQKRGRRSEYEVTSKIFTAKEPKAALPPIVSAPRHKAGFDGVVPNAIRSAPCGESGEPVMRSPEELELRKQRKLESAPRRKTA